MIGAALALLLVAAQPALFQDGFESMADTGVLVSETRSYSPGVGVVQTFVLGNTRHYLMPPWNGYSILDPVNGYLSNELLVAARDWNLSIGGPGIPSDAVVVGLEAFVNVRTTYVADETTSPFKVSVYHKIDKLNYFRSAERTIAVSQPLYFSASQTSWMSTPAGASNDLWYPQPGDEFADDETVALISTPAHWNNQTANWVGLFYVIRNVGTLSRIVQVLDPSIRIYYLPAQSGISVRFNAATTMSVAMNARRQSIKESMRAAVTMTPSLRSMKNLPSRIYDGPLKGRAIFDAHLTRNVGGVRSTYLFPQLRSTGRLTPTMRSSFTVNPYKASASLDAQARAMRQPTDSTRARVSSSMSVSLIGGRPVIAAMAAGSASLSVSMTKARTINQSASASAVVSAALAAQRPLDGSGVASAAMNASLIARRPVTDGVPATASATLNVALSKAQPLAVSMTATAIARGDDGRAFPDLSNLFWRPSLQSIDAEPWGRDIDQDEWQRDIDED